MIRRAVHRTSSLSKVLRQETSLFTKTSNTVYNRANISKDWRKNYRSAYEDTYADREKNRQDLLAAAKKSGFRFGSRQLLSGTPILIVTLGYCAYVIMFQESERDKLDRLIAERNADFFKQQSTVVGDSEDEMEITHIVYFDVTHGNNDLGRILVGLYGKVVPKTVENFVEISKKATGGYKNTKFHRVIQDFMIQGGDTTKGNGSGGISIYGRTFEDENFAIPHFEYCLSMANKGPNTNGSQFFITTGPTPWLNGKHVVFGKVVEGTEIVDKMELVPTGKNDVPASPLIVKDCGVIDIKQYIAKQDAIRKQQEEEENKLEAARKKKRKGTSSRPAPLPVAAVENQEKQ